MKKILMTTLFAGTMFISNDICANNILNQNHEQENAAENLQEQIHLRNQFHLKNQLQNILQQKYRDLSNVVQESILGLNFNDEENLGIEQDNIIAMIQNIRQRVESAREMH